MQEIFVVSNFFLSYSNFRHPKIVSEMAIHEKLIPAVKMRIKYFP